ncbi:glycoside hydrolase family 65 protein [Carnobacterium maltaromaticum]|uniref:glycoside hydrolase family 65 protein n=1 Tax=Carnobacterium maltaromaticum TaxID=2751 RepID=UPI00295EFC0A|nr:glycoside hydrolase family 65 protein [Carnobacterium maltaromaticum]
MIQRLFDIDSWKVATTKLDKEHKRLQESLTAIGNGYMGMRGNFEEGYSGDSHVGTYLAGVWYPDKTRVGWWKNGYPDYFGKVINATNFIGVDIFVNQHKVDTFVDEIKDFHLELDLQTGILHRHYTWVSGEIEIKFSFKRFVSVAQKELCIVEVAAEVLKGEATIQFNAKLDGNVTNEDSNYDEKFWLEMDRGLGEYSYLTTKTIPNDFEIPQFTVTTMMKNRASDEKKGHTTDQEMLVREQFDYQLKAGEKAKLTKLIAVVTSRDIEPNQQVAKAEELLRVAEDAGISKLEREHKIVWGKRWHKADVVIAGDPESQQGIRFNIFQLFSTYYGEDARLNVGPKGFTGEKYGGATYWDTEAYIVPMYLSVTEPEVSQQLLKYRHDQLPGALHNARQQGLKGALYPMVTFTGIECHNEWEITFEEIHRNAAIAYAIYNYTNYTGDEAYLLSDGIDVLTEISRFWADRVHYSKRNEAYMLHGVTGPNEYENNVNNNWYTNTMATWVLRYTLESLKKVSKEKLVDLQITETEKDQWQDIIAKMYYPKNQELGIFVQHDTFLDKDLRSVETLAATERPLNQHWSWDKILRSCFIKQADVLQGLYFLNNEYTIEEKKKNFEFYEPMTVHESSLSACIHAILAAEVGLEDKAVELYARTARLDLDNYNNDTEDGLHITSMSGSWLAIVQGFAGMRTYENQLQFKPFCPKGWDGYEFKISYRGRLLKIIVTKTMASVILVEGEALDLTLCGENVRVTDQVQQAI